MNIRYGELIFSYFNHKRYKADRVTNINAEYLFLHLVLLQKVCVCVADLLS